MTLPLPIKKQMRFLSTFLFLIVLLSKIASQPCNSPNVTLNNQVDVQSFLTQNGSCSEITGNLVIGANVQHLDGLENIKKIGGYLSISNCEMLTNINGLQNLEEVGSWLRLQNNPQLKSLAGLNHLNKVNEFLYISGSPHVKSLDALLHLDTINGIFQIWNMDSLQNLSGLSSLKSVIGDCAFFSNPNLHSLKGLDSLTTIEGGLRIYKNRSLTSILDLNPSLKIDAQIAIYENAELRNCNANVVCERIASSPNSITIETNNDGCESIDEVSVLCITDAKEALPNTFLVYPNPVYDVLTIEGLDKTTKVDIYSVNGKLVKSILTDRIIDLNTLPKGVYALKLLNDHKTVIKL